ncbi:ankyrin repeat domain-containing protein [Dactylosporangium aurantiacum]|uniref:Ankyrin repeat domain-containing protein n=1 Tax=Dactylosporangium aurantiacum TaxID=35754 RepID=A0A9Q9MEN4_9ACTN|nr:ankyrin repeat domain-containing protein [Dactylosporangium aurantiacum]MDG6105115.1 ankyrin repeat domain-containing protein [Dactylosporangium aurantiacum]UWZ51640.1 ankyrin repeat domain-containing protein [Dactylosporangium aurantiacum]
MRRYGVPAGMIEAATQRRSAGDWRGACRAANVDAGVDLAAVRRSHGAELAARVADDLAHLVPDLLRWHLPAAAEPVTATGTVTALRRYEDGSGLFVRTATAWDQPQRLRLRFGPLDAADLGHSLHLSPERWDDRHTTELLARCGGRTRLPFFTADGTPLPPDRLGGDDHEGRTERVVRLFQADRAAEAWTVAGFTVDAPAYLLRHPRPGLTMLAERARHLAAATGSDTVTAPLPSWYAMLLDRLDGPSPRVRVVPAHDGLPPGVPVLPYAAHQWPTVLDDLRGGALDPAQLHPLAGAALFPARAAPTMPAPARLPGPVEIRCGATWHEVAVRDGALRVPHPPQELTRELALHALARRVEPGCAVAVQGWRTCGGWLPTALIQLRKEVLGYVMHGEGGTVEALLDAGLDPALLDPMGRTLLHLLPWLFPADARMRVLDRLLAAGLDADARDRHGRTPLHYAVQRGAPAALIRALLAAGADPAPPGPPLPTLAAAARREEVAALLAAAAPHPSGDGRGDHGPAAEGRATDGPPEGPRPEPPR